LLRLDLFNGPWADRDYNARQQRRKELLAQYERAWLAPFLAAKAHRAYIDCGMVTCVFPSRAVLAADAAEAHLTEEWAWLRHLVLECDEGDARRVGASPVLGSAPGLTLEVGNAALEALLDSPHLCTVHDISLCQTKLDNDGVRLVASSSRLTGLRSLNLGLNRFGDEGLVALSESRGLGQLEWLCLRRVQFLGGGIGPAGITALFHSSTLPSLAWLELYNNRVGDAGAEGIASGRVLPQLEYLHLGACRIGAKGIAALVRSPHLAAVRDLSLMQNPFGRAGAKALAAALPPGLVPNAGLDSCGLDDTAFKQLVQSTTFRGAAKLDLSRNQKLTDTTAETIAAEAWPNLEEINLSMTKCSEAAVRVLKSSPGLARLREVRI
jgi:hypothetical protein